MTRTAAITDGVSTAARWHLVARLFERPHADWHAAIGVLAREMDDGALQALVEVAASVGEGAYLAILGPGGVVSAREVGHVGAFRDPGWVLSDLRRFYEAFGYAPRGEDPIDHVAAELGFVAYLHLKETHALAAGDADAAQVTAEAREAFATAHLAPFMASLARRLDGAPGHFAAAASLAASWLPAVPLPAGDDVPDPLADGCAGCVGEG
jgi:hypothetical protein